MRRNILFWTLLASVLLGTEAGAANPYTWTAQTNEELYGDALSYLRTVQTDLIGEPLYYKAQDLVFELQAVHKKDAYAWMGQIHRFVSMLEDIYPPVLGHPRVGPKDKYDKIRRHLARLRDFPMHEVSLQNGTDDFNASDTQAQAFRKANKEWLQDKREKFFQTLLGPRPAPGTLQVIKLYSSGVVFRTAEACVGIDLCYEDGFYDAVRRDELAAALDAVYVTHAHGDHYDLALLRMVLERGKDVCGPYTMDRHFTGTYPGKKHFWEGDRLEPFLVGGVAMTQAVMGSQGGKFVDGVLVDDVAADGTVISNKEPCMLFLVDLGGWRFLGVGDNSIRDKLSYYKEYPTVDIAVAPVFVGIRYLFDASFPAPNPDGVEYIYVNIHENEWHHTINGRISYYYLFTESNAFGNANTLYPSYSLLDCGESILLTK